MKFYIYNNFHNNNKKFVFILIIKAVVGIMFKADDSKPSFLDAWDL